jgi:demethylmenaquinone methyltransferase/2-methoxy-6-polyprenyl-1,4-benzoquinol methylase
MITNALTPSLTSKIEYNTVANTYDFVEAIFSFGLMNSCRKEIANWLSNRGPIRILDLCCGTGNQILSFFSTKLNIISVNGIDLSEGMLKRAKQKITRSHLNNYVFLEKSDACDLRFKDNFFDAVTISYSLRDIYTISLLFNEAHRVLKTDCPFLILDQRNPEYCRFKYLYSLYLRYIFSSAGGLISGFPEMYKMIYKNITAQQETDALCKLLKSSGFYKINAYNLSLGSAFFISGKKRVN